MLTSSWRNRSVKENKNITDHVEQALVQAYYKRMYYVTFDNISQFDYIKTSKEIAQEAIHK